MEPEQQQVWIPAGKLKIFQYAYIFKHYIPILRRTQRTCMVLIYSSTIFSNLLLIIRNLKCMECRQCMVYILIKEKIFLKVSSNGTQPTLYTLHT